MNASSLLLQCFPLDVAFTRCCLPSLPPDKAADSALSRVSYVMPPPSEPKSTMHAMHSTTQRDPSLSPEVSPLQCPSPAPALSAFLIGAPQVTSVGGRVPSDMYVYSM